MADLATHDRSIHTGQPLHGLQATITWTLSLLSASIEQTGMKGADEWGSIQQRAGSALWAACA